MAPEAAEGAMKAPHKLQRQWAFWFDDQSKPKQGVAHCCYIAVSVFVWRGRSVAISDSCGFACIYSCSCLLIELLVQLYPTCVEFTVWFEIVRVWFRIWFDIVSIWSRM